MFNDSLTQHQGRDPRFNQGSLSQERLQPDGNSLAGWFRRLKWKWTQNRRWTGQAAGSELFVPDGCSALLLLDGKPERWQSSRMLSESS